MRMHVHIQKTTESARPDIVWKPYYLKNRLKFRIIDFKNTVWTPFILTW